MQNSFELLSHNKIALNTITTEVSILLFRTIHYVFPLTIVALRICYRLKKNPAVDVLLYSLHLSASNEFVLKGQIPHWSLLGAKGSNVTNPWWAWDTRGRTSSYSATFFDDRGSYFAIGDIANL